MAFTANLIDWTSQINPARLHHPGTVTRKGHATAVDDAIRGQIIACAKGAPNKALPGKTRDTGVCTDAKRIKKFRRPRQGHTMPVPVKLRPVSQTQVKAGVPVDRTRAFQ